MDCCYGKNPYNFKVDPTQTGRVAAYLDLTSNIAHGPYGMWMCHLVNVDENR